MADTDTAQDTDDDSVYMTLFNALHWIAFRNQPTPDDDESIADFERAYPVLARAYKAGKVKLLGQAGEFEERKEIPILQLDDPHFEAIGNVVYLKSEPWDPRCWVGVRLERQEVLAEWPEPRQPEKPSGHASTRKSWTQDRTDYWITRAIEIRNESPRLSLLQIAQKIKKEDAPDHLPDDQKEVWKKKGWTTENIHRRLKGQL